MDVMTIAIPCRKPSEGIVDAEMDVITHVEHDGDRRGVSLEHVVGELDDGGDEETAAALEE
eukprot:CAMPEP_0206159870 /NCGR_PEP_ID=MMETSP1474-20131121/6258_1 /ASSEMBLY_ACC=CAM_ASM_001110 /TAXON_ID=97495 /ORGANISM="Imantonia sp., Strain RCC918" /LENGTH=60 /DNA_ID=CAMNT_0053560879 /DNA_START=334 /DNA_END=512 /DNA_ORIENTATION=-